MAKKGKLLLSLSAPRLLMFCVAQILAHLPKLQLQALWHSVSLAKSLRLRLPLQHPRSYATDAVVLHQNQLQQARLHSVQTSANNSSSQRRFTA